MLFIGIDPGGSGGIAVLGPKKEIVALYKLPPTLLGIRTVAGRWNGDAFVMLERIGGFMAAKDETWDGSRKMNVAAAHTMFTMGRNFGWLESVLLCCRLHYELVMPSVWHRSVGIDPRYKGESRTNWKGRIAEHARKLFPGTDITLATADALLIALYCWQAKKTVEYDRHQPPAGER